MCINPRILYNFNVLGSREVGEHATQAEVILECFDGIEWIGKQQQTRKQYDRTREHKRL